MTILSADERAQNKVGKVVAVATPHGYYGLSCWIPYKLCSDWLELKVGRNRRSLVLRQRTEFLTNVDEIVGPNFVDMTIDNQNAFATAFVEEFERLNELNHEVNHWTETVIFKFDEPVHARFYNPDGTVTDQVKYHKDFSGAQRVTVFLKKISADKPKPASFSTDYVDVPMEEDSELREVKNRMEQMQQHLEMRDASILSHVQGAVQAAATQAVNMALEQFTRQSQPAGPHYPSGPTPDGAPSS